MFRLASRLAVLVILLESVSSCAPKPAHVAMTFDDDWRLGTDVLTRDEQTLVKTVAIQTLNAAFAEFDVHVGDEGEHVIRVESTRYTRTGPGAIAVAGAVGVTYPVTKVSTVHPDALYLAELAASRCANLDTCVTKTRAQLLDGLGRGIGATAAHELGHQAGFHFSRDSRCDECYDGNAATTYVHFFGVKHWSPEAHTVMRRELPSPRHSP